MATKKFKCNVCGYIHEGDAAPANCPVCGVPASEFTELKPEKKGLFSDKNGNAYIIMYSTVMVVIVATLLALAALARGREVAVSRGELVEIGDGFRIHDILEQSGARHIVDRPAELLGLL